MAADVIYLDKRGTFIGKSALFIAAFAPQNVAQAQASMGPRIRFPWQANLDAGLSVVLQIIKSAVGQCHDRGWQSGSWRACHHTPAAFNQCKNEDTIAAGSLAGLEKVSLPSEPCSCLRR